jgi:hypothetical protein
MNMMKLVATSVAVATTLMLGCSASPEPTNDDAPVVETDSVSAQDEGASYNGWSQAPIGHITTYVYPWGDSYAEIDSFGGTFSRSYGDSTRGGGSCFVTRRASSSCSVDSTCTASAVAEFGAGAYGYCYQGTCWDRPGGAGDYCTQNPNRSPGAFSVWTYMPQSGWIPVGHDTIGIVGCMTKTAGPNTGCGSTNTTLSMRTIGGFNNDYVYY